MKMGFKLEGGKELDAALKDLGKSYTARRVGGKASERALQPVVETAQQLAPVGDHTFEHSRRFHYVETIGIGARLNASQASGERRVSGARGKDVLVRYVGSSSPLAHLFEFGTGPRKQSSTGRYTGVMAPHPHMRQAWEQNTGQVLDILTRELRIELDKAIARAAKKALKAKK